MVVCLLFTLLFSIHSHSASSAVNNNLSLSVYGRLSNHHSSNHTTVASFCRITFLSKSQHWVQLNQSFIFCLNSSCKLLNHFVSFLTQLVQFLLNLICGLTFTIPSFESTNQITKTVVKSNKIKVISSTIRNWPNHATFNCLIGIIAMKSMKLKNKLLVRRIMHWSITLFCSIIEDIDVPHWVPNVNGSFWWFLF